MSKKGMYALLRLSSAQCRRATRYFFACCLAFVQVTAFSQALPAELPPFNNPTSSNGFTYGVIPNSTYVGREERVPRSFAANQPKYSATVVRTIPTSVAANAAVKLFKSLPGISTAAVLFEIAQAVGGRWVESPQGRELEVPEQKFGCAAPFPNTVGYYVGLPNCSYSAGRFWPSVTVDVERIGGACKLVMTCENGARGVRSHPEAPIITYRPATDAEIEAEIRKPHLEPRAIELADSLDDALPPSDPRRLPWSDPGTERMPQPQTGEPTTKVNPDGSVTSTRTRHIPFRKPDGSIAWREETSGETVFPPNTTSNPTAVTVTTPIGTTTAPAKPEELDPCTINPRRAGCAELGEAQEAIPKATKDITYQAENIFGGGTCPADRYQTIRGQEIKVWDFQQTCQFASSYLRPVILTLASFAAFFIVTGVRVES